MTLRKLGHASLAGGPIMLRRGWPHDPAKLPARWPHDPANRHSCDHGSMSTILIGCEEVDASLAERTPAPRELCNFQFRGEERAPNLSPIGECPNFRNFRSSPPRSL